MALFNGCFPTQIIALIVLSDANIIIVCLCTTKEK